MSVVLEKPRPRPARVNEPRILEMPSERMAVVETFGDPNQVAKQAIPALYGAVDALKFASKRVGQDFKVRPLRARWLKAKGHVPSEFHGLWGLPVPPLTRAIPQRVSGMPVRLETWNYGTVAEILHLGPYGAEAPTIARLLTFIREHGFEISGVHEEEYLSRPDAKVPKTLIRYPITNTRQSKAAST